MDKKKKKLFFISAGILVGFGMLLGALSKQSTDSADAGSQGLTEQQLYWYNQVNHRAVEYGNPGVTYNGQ